MSYGNLWPSALMESHPRAPAARSSQVYGVMLANRSMVQSVVIPELAYRNVREAVSWLCATFGFIERLRIGEHRAQLTFPGGGAVVVMELSSEQTTTSEAVAGHRVMVRVPDVDGHYRRAVKHGAKILSPPTDYPYGERQYSTEDLDGHRWKFSQSIADVDPAAWGGELIEAPDA